MSLQHRISSVGETLSQTLSLGNADYHPLIDQLENQIETQDLLIASLREQLEILSGHRCCVDAWVKRRVREMDEEERDGESAGMEWDLPVFGEDGCATGRCVERLVEEFLETVRGESESESLPGEENGERTCRNRVEDGSDHELNQKSNRSIRKCFTRSHMYFDSSASIADT